MAGGEFRLKDLWSSNQENETFEKKLPCDKTASDLALHKPSAVMLCFVLSKVRHSKYILFKHRFSHFLVHISHEMKYFSDNALALTTANFPRLSFFLTKVIVWKVRNSQHKEFQFPAHAITAVFSQEYRQLSSRGIDRRSLRRYRKALLPYLCCNLITLFICRSQENETLWFYRRQKHSGFRRHYAGLPLRLVI